MNVFIAYSINQNDTFMIPIISTLLMEKGIVSKSRENKFLESIDLNIIDDFQGFIGIVTNVKYFNGVFAFHEYAKSKNIPCILIIDDNCNLEKDVNMTFVVPFSRTQPKAYESIFNYKNIIAPDQNASSNLFYFLGAVVVDALTRTLSNSIQNNMRPKLNSLHVVEGRLLHLNGARFQELCDVLLTEQISELKHLNRVGSQFGSQKTIIGSPDTLVELNNGRYILVEITTQKKSLVTKIISDIDKSVNEHKTHIEIKQIYKLIICCNSKLSVSDIAQITKYTKSIGISNLDIFDLNTISTQLYLNHRLLARDYLDLALDSGQIVPIDTFIENYNKSVHSFATPLDNPLYHRSNEINELTKNILSSYLVLVSGPAGVGKTRLAVEAIKQFCIDNPQYQAFSIINRDADILEDFYANFKEGGQYLLFIDDVNRFSRINTVLGFLRSAQNFELRIVLTTRDYGLQYIRSVLVDIKYYSMSVGSLKDEELTDILNSDPFNIRSKPINMILAIAEGNTRLAIMAAELAIKEQDIGALNDVSDLLNMYFNTFTKDQAIFNDKTLLKTIGIISFFYTFPFSNKNVIEEACVKFKIAEEELISAIDTLEQLEFLQINFEQAKIADQTIATFYFYKVFVKDKLLSFYDLLNNYFVRNEGRFRDAFYPMASSYGFDKIKELTVADLSKYLKSLDSEDEQFNFLKVFYFYMQEECLVFVLAKSTQLPPSDLPDNFEYKSANNQASEKDAYIDLLDNFFETDVQLKATLEVSFEYVRRRPEAIKNLLDAIVSELTFDEEDHYHNYNRQRILIDLFEEKIHNGDELYVQSFLAVAHEFLEFAFRKTKAGRKHAIHMYSIRFILTDESKSIRTRIWTLLSQLFDKYPEQVLKNLNKHGGTKPDFLKEVMEFDLQFVIPMIEQKLNPANFSHSLYVHELLYWLKRKEIVVGNATDIKSKFKNREFLWYQKIRWDRLRGKEEFEFKDWNDFERKKEADIRNHVFFNNAVEFSEFISFVNSAKKISNHDAYQINNSIDIIIDQSLKNDKVSGFNYFRLALNQLNNDGYSLARTIASLAEDKSLQDLFWQLHLNGEVSDYATLNFLSRVPLSDIDEKYLSSFYKLLENTLLDIYLLPDHYPNLLKKDADFGAKVLQISLRKNDQENSAKIRIDERFIEDIEPETVEAAVLIGVYIQQQKLRDHFDHNGDCFVKLLELDTPFLKEFLLKTSDPMQHQEFSGKVAFSRVWKMQNRTEILATVIETIASEDLYVDESFANAFFENVPPDCLEARDEYLLNYIQSNFKEPSKINLIFEVINKSVKGLFDKAFITYLRLNQSVEDFKQISWLGLDKVFFGDVIIGDIKAQRWRALLQLVESASLGFEILFIIKFIKDEIESEKRYGDWERERSFLSRR